MVFEAKKGIAITLHVMICKPVGTSITCDKFDRFVVTMTGTDILHNKVGITYQASFKDKFNVPYESVTDHVVTENLADFKK